MYAFRMSHKILFFKVFFFSVCAALDTTQDIPWYQFETHWGFVKEKSDKYFTA